MRSIIASTQRIGYEVTQRAAQANGPRRLSDSELMASMIR
jgi:hypothetical protein